MLPTQLLFSDVIKTCVSSHNFEEKLQEAESEHSSKKILVLINDTTIK